jgi:hypothetical protein
MAREWAYGLAYRSHRERNQALPHWLDHYNRLRPHSSLGGRAPISRVHNVCGHARGATICATTSRLARVSPLRLTSTKVGTPLRGSLLCLGHSVYRQGWRTTSQVVLKAVGGATPKA